MQRRILTFDLFRSVASFAVVFGHLRNLFFTDYSSIQYNIFTRVFYFLSGFGHQAVIIFFVLSGILIGQKAYSDILKGSWSWKTYLFDRFTRLWIVVLPALVLTFALDKIGMGMFPVSNIYGGDRLGGNVISSPIQSSLTVFLGNALFLQNIFVAIAGSNVALWSLSNEFWYYITFPPVVLGIRHLTQRRRVNMSLMIGVLLLFWLKRVHFIEGFLIWSMGWFMLTNFHSPSKKGHSKFWTWMIGLFFVGVLVFSRLYQTALNDWALGLVSSLLCFTVVTNPPEVALRIQKIWAFFSSFSFSLYVTHLPVLVFLRALLVRGETRWTLDLPHCFAALLIFGSCYFIAWVFSVFTEQKTQWLKSQLRGFSQKFRTAPSLPL